MNRIGAIILELPAIRGWMAGSSVSQFHGPTEKYLTFRWHLIFHPATIFMRKIITGYCLICI
jgi:hypothetical protein